MLVLQQNILCAVTDIDFQCTSVCVCLRSEGWPTKTYNTVHVCFNAEKKIVKKLPKLEICARNLMSHKPPKYTKRLYFKCSLCSFWMWFAHLLDGHVLQVWKLSQNLFTCFWVLVKLTMEIPCKQTELRVLSGYLSRTDVFCWAILDKWKTSLTSSDKLVKHVHSLVNYYNKQNYWNAF